MGEKKRIVEKHITVTEETFKKLEHLCKKETRSKRAIVTRLIDRAFEESKND